MAYRLRIIQGNRMTDIPLERMRSYSIGEGDGVQYALPSGSCHGANITFSWQGNWMVQAQGTVYHKGVALTQAIAHIGEQFVLNEAQNIAVRLLNFEDQPVLQIQLRPQDELTIGRKSHSLLQLKDPRISGHHAVIRYHQGQWHLCDLGSTNGTYVNGQAIREHILAENDKVYIGSFELDYTVGVISVLGQRANVVSSYELPENELHKKSVKPIEKNTSAMSVDSPGQPKAYPTFSRSPRTLQAFVAPELEIEAAPGIGQKPEINWLSVLLPGIGTAVSTLLITVVTAMSPLFLLFTGPMMLIGIFTSVTNYRNQLKKFKDLQSTRQEKYLAYLGDCEKSLQQAVQQRRSIAEYNAPAIEQCIKIAEKLDQRLWERKPTDEDFLCLRIGTGTVPSELRIKTPKVGFVLEEDQFTYAPREVAARYESIEQFPITCNLRDFPSLGIVGKRDQTLQAARLLAIQAAALHGYDELKIVALFPAAEKKQWDWLRWLPHTFDDMKSERYLACTPYDAQQMLSPLESVMKQRSTSASYTNFGETAMPLPHYLFLIADLTLLNGLPMGEYLLRGTPELGLSCVVLAEELRQLPRNMHQLLEISAPYATLYAKATVEHRQTLLLENVSLESCDRFARALAPIRLPEQNAAQLLPNSISFLEGYRVQKADQLDLADYWSNACAYRSMSVPIGIKVNGERFFFDINEHADGPHGLVAGTTGSGKSEMVQTWILSMAVQFSPEQVSFVLIDFKGTGLILPFTRLPHLAGTISDLDTNITRNLLALEAELQRRKALFDSVGVNSIRGYLQLYQAGKVSEPLPYLFVVIDEYAEFKVKFPEFTDEVNSLFRTGRSMGVHIVLLTQNPAGVVSAESETNVRFRWCLKVASTAASKEVLGGHDEAAKLTRPGRAYVRVGADETFEMIQSFYSGAPYQPDKVTNTQGSLPISLVDLRGQRRVVAQSASAKRNVGANRTEIEAVVRHIEDYTRKNHIPPARAIWQPRLPAQVFLPELLQQLAPSTDDALAPIIGLSDDPRAQEQCPLTLPLSEEGHALICGAPGSGKTTLLQTLILALCCQYTAQQVNIYIMDFGSWSLGMFRDFPHVGGIANDNEEDKITKTAALIEATLDERKKVFAQAGVGSLRAYREITGTEMPYIVLILDNFVNVYNLYPGLESFFLRLGREGGSYGIYLVATAAMPLALGYKLAQSVKTMWALQLKSRTDYTEVVGRTEGLEPEALPGRGLCKKGRILEFQTALPTTGGDAARTAAIRALGATTAAKWSGKRAAPIPILPEHIPYGSVKTNLPFTMGLQAENLQPVGFTFDGGLSLLISAKDEAERNSVLQMLVRQMQGDTKAEIIGYGIKLSESAGCHPMQDTAALDACLAALVPELTKRQQQRKAGSTEEFSPLYLVLNGWKQCFAGITEDSARRIQAIQTLGKGLQVYLLVADCQENVDTLYHQWEPVTQALLQGPLLVLGGTPKDHIACAPRIPTAQRSTALKEMEGYFCTEQTSAKIKLMEPT